MSSSPLASRKRTACPLCARPSAQPYAPFCSAGCRDRDLLQWLGDGYRIAGPPVHDTDSDDDPSALDKPRHPPL